MDEDSESATYLNMWISDGSTQDTASGAASKLHKRGFPPLRRCAGFRYEWPMPAGNNFQHSTYSRSDPGERAAYAECQPGAPPDSMAWQDAMAGHGAALAGHGVRAVVFLHGSVLGTDPFGVQRLDQAGGLKRGYSRGIPGIDALLALMRDDTSGLPALPGGHTPPFHDDEATKKLLDDQAGEAANFTAGYVEQAKTALNRNASRPIACRRILWSSQHHHLGRAQAAVQLLDRLKDLSEELKLGSGDRILVQAHGHAGLLLAIISNLLSPDSAPGRAAFLQVLQSSARQPGTSPHVAKAWATVGEPLTREHIFNGARLDVVTFGTPVRYGWDTAGIGALLHIVNHRPMRLDGKRWLAKMELPQITMEMPTAWGGDYVQQLAVAGSDAVPDLPDAQATNKALWELLEPYDNFERWLECARKCVRCQNDGKILLVDYKDAGPASPREHVYGHAAYTRTNALLFNTAAIRQALYP